MAIVCLILGGVFGSVFTNISRNINPDYIHVRILDYSECEATQYKILFKEKVVSIEGQQIYDETQMMAAKTDRIIRILPKRNSDDKIEYSIKAFYKDCPSLIGKGRVVKAGSSLYESIRDGAVNHRVRSH